MPPLERDPPEPEPPLGPPTCTYFTSLCSYRPLSPEYLPSFDGRYLPSSLGRYLHAHRHEKRIINRSHLTENRRLNYFPSFAELSFAGRYLPSLWPCTQATATSSTTIPTVFDITFASRVQHEEGGKALLYGPCRCRERKSCCNACDAMENRKNERFTTLLHFTRLGSAAARRLQSTYFCVFG